MTEANSLLQHVAAWSAAGLGLAGSAALLRRRLSRDRTAISKDKVEMTFVEQLVKERDSALAEWRSAILARQADSEAIARLTAQNAPATLALQLMIAEGAPVLQSVGINIDATGLKIEFGTTWFAGDRVTLTVKPD